MLVMRMPGARGVPLPDLARLGLPAAQIWAAFAPGRQEQDS